MKVALCFFGQPRLLENPHTYNSHVKNIINKYSTDVYVHNWISSENNKFTYSDWALDKMQEDWKQEHSQDVKDRINEMYSPIASKFDTIRTFQLSDNSRKLVKNLSFYSTNNENNTLSQLYSISECIKLIQKDDYDFEFMNIGYNSKKINIIKVNYNNYDIELSDYQYTVGNFQFKKNYLRTIAVIKINNSMITDFIISVLKLIYLHFFLLGFFAA